MVVQGDVTHERFLQIFTTGESMRFEHIGDAPIESLDHAIGSGRAWLGQAVFNARGLTQLVKLMLTRGLALTAGKQPVGELLAVVGQEFLHPDRANLVQGAQKRAGSRSRFVILDLNKHPALRTVNGHKQIAPAALVGHLGQVFDIDVNEPRPVALWGCEGSLGLRALRLPTPWQNINLSIQEESRSNFFYGRMAIFDFMQIPICFMRFECFR